MGKVILGTTMSLDGFMTDRNGSVEYLYHDLDALRNSEPLQESIRTTGAVVMGRRAYAMGDPDSFADNYEYQVPIFVVTHRVPEKLPRQNKKLTVTFVTDGIESAVKQAKAAAVGKDVTIVGGAQTAQQLLKAGLVDELQIEIMPILLGTGLRFFEHLDALEIQLERLKVVELPTRTIIRFRVVKQSQQQAAKG